MAGNNDLLPGTHTLELTDGLSGLDGARLRRCQAGLL